MKKKYQVKITGQINGNSIAMDIPVELDLNHQALTKAILEAKNSGIKEIEVENVMELEDSEQLEIPFEQEDYTESTEEDLDEEYTPYGLNAAQESQSDQNDEDSEENAEDEEFDNCDSSYTPYSSIVPPQTDVSSEESQAEEVENPSSIYTPYASLLKNNKDKAVSFVPQIKDCYVPYSRKIVPIPEKYLKFKFE